MTHMVTVHGNISKPGMFGSFEGQLVPANAAIIKAAQNGQLRIEMPWLLDNYEQAVVISGAIADHLYHTAVHPLTGTIKCSLFTEHLIIAVCKYNVNSYRGSSHHYCLFDVLHEGNTKKTR